MADLCIQDLARLTHLPDNPNNPAELIAAQKYYDVEFTGGSISNVTLTDVTINGTETARNETIISAPGDYAVQPDDYIITVVKTVPEITTITLPAVPTESRSIIVKDGQGEATDFNITIDGNGQTIDDAPTLVMSVNWGSYEIIYNGTQWNVIGSYKDESEGDVVGPASSTDDALAAFDGTTGKVLQNTGATIAAGVITATGFVGPLTGNASTATALQTPRTIGNVSFDGTADIVPQTIQVADAASDASTFVMLAGSATGNLPVLTDAGLTYNASTNNLTATTFTGALSGNATTATTATNGTVANEASDTTCFPLFVTAATGGLPFKSSASLTYNSSTGAFGATTIGGTLTTAAQTNITSVGTLTGLTMGGTLAMGSNSITMTGSLASTGSRVTKGWFADIESTNAPTIGGVAATGSGGLARATSPTFVTPVLGAASATSVAFTSTSGIIGTTTNNNAAAGSVGEVATATLASGSAISLTSGATANITSISLTAGDWDVWGTVVFSPAATTTVTAILSAISTTSGTFPSEPDESYATTRSASYTPGSTLRLPTGTTRVSLASTTTVYLVVAAGFATSTMTAYGKITARRRR